MTRKPWQGEGLSRSPVYYGEAMGLGISRDAAGALEVSLSGQGGTCAAKLPAALRYWPVPEHRSDLSTGTEMDLP